MISPRTSTLIGIIFSAAAARLIPHPPNFTPIDALALFGGAQFADKRLAFGAPIAALFLSDLVLGLHHGVLSVYASFALIVCLGMLLRERRSVLAVAAAAMSSALLFFVVIDFAVWAGGKWYPHTAAGLAACYVAAIPFLWNQLAGDLLYCALLFGGFALAQRRWPRLGEPGGQPV